MTGHATASALLQRLLDDRFEAGRETGYAQAMREILDAVQASLDGQIEQASASPEEPIDAGFAEDPGEENDTDLPATVDCLPPYLRRAFQYVQLHPGMTAQMARIELNNRNVLYRLAQLGLVEKRGTQFYPTNAAAQR